MAARPTCDFLPQRWKVFSHLLESAPWFSRHGVFNFEQRGMRFSSPPGVLFFPVFRDAEALRDMFFRAAWYLAPVLDEVAQVDFLVTEAFGIPGISPGYMCREAEEYAKKLRAKSRFIRVGGDEAVSRAFRDARIVMVWESGCWDPPVALQNHQVFQRREWTFFHVDRMHSQREASTWLDVLRLFGHGGPRIVNECREKFSRMLERLGRHEQAFVFGTGPSLAELENIELPAGIRVVANSIIRNARLMERLQPSVVCFGDPVFHAGCSMYAGEFRDLLRQAMERYPIYALIPLTHYAHYRAILPKALFERTIGVPIRKLGGFNFDLTSNFAVQQTGNILTMMMLPVASTLAREISIAGCDRRPDTKQAYFWSHDQSSQIVDKLDAAKQAHPGFFDISYVDYYDQHCKMLESLLREAEYKGRFFRTLTTSFIPALKNRVVPKTPIIAKSSGKEERRVIYTFYSTLVGKQPEEERALLALWKTSWQAQGWEPIVLNEDAVQHDAEALFMIERFEQLPSINKRNLDYCCYLRWLAVAHVGGGFMCDYDVINYGLPPQPFGELTLYERNVPCLVSGTAAEFLRVARFFAAYRPGREDRIGNRPHVSDMMILSRNPWLFRKANACGEFGRCGWETAPTVHFSNFSMRPHGYMPRHIHIPKLRALRSPVPA